jgi:nitrous oxidase accessory protein NosD
VKGGISCVGGSNHTISNNTLDGIWLMASDVRITDNLISGYAGIAIGGPGNTVFNNTVVNCSVGVTFWSYAADNLLFCNSFINNSVQAKIDRTYNPVVGEWYYEGKGNYWSSYNGADIDGDGIGDSPYVIDANNVDRYPLMSPWGAGAPQVRLGFSQTILIIIAIVVLLIVVAGLLFYHKKHKHNSG